MTRITAAPMPTSAALISAAASPQLSPMPGRRNLRKEERLAQLLRRVEAKGVRKVAGLFKNPGEPGYNPDAEVPWKDSTTATRAALLLTQGVMAAERMKNAGNGAAAVFGVVMMQPKIESASEWETFAKQVHSQSQQAAIEAVVIEPPDDPDEAA
jgi:hypothetical protein